MPSGAVGVALPLVALDAGRRALVRLFGPLARPLLVARDTRVAFFGALGLAVAFVLALACPAWSVGVGTVVLGVPHVISDVRYLVVRRALTRRWSLYVGVGLAVVGTALGYGLRAALVGAALATVFARATLARRALVLFGLAVLFAIAWHGRSVTDLVYAQAHNLVAVGIFAMFARRAGKVAWLPLVLFVVLAAFLLHPAAVRALVWAGGLHRAPGTLGVDVLANQLAPFADASWAVRGVSFFAFAQAAHYVVWLRLVPELDRSSPRPRSFRQTGRALLGDLGPWLLVFFGVGTLVFVTWAFVDIARARMAYLQSAFFHGYLEIAALALFACEGFPVPGVATSPMARKSD